MHTRLYLILILVFPGTGLYSQFHAGIDPPKSVLAKFDSLYPRATEKNWDIDSVEENGYMVKKNYQIHYDVDFRDSVDEVYAVYNKWENKYKEIWRMGGCYRVPNRVKKVFDSLFPKAVDVKWNNEGWNNSPEVGALFSVGLEYTDPQYSSAARFDSTGKLNGYTLFIPVQQLPAGIAEYLKRKYPKYDKVLGFLEYDDNSYSYTVSIEKSNNDRKCRFLYFDKDGGFKESYKCNRVFIDPKR